jgi:bifunctional UDP-N-acetylglucosamine pyrophosphorylase/glucosamine-1-phosphate N-acetyltransferase
MVNFVAIILAAGKGKRMKSKYPKVMHKIGGKPLLYYVLKNVNSLNIKEKILVVGYKAEEVIKNIGENIKYVVQKKLLGTAHAVLQTEKLLKNYNGNVLILYGDVPFLSISTLKSLMKKHLKENASCSILTAEMENPYGYGRIIRDENGNIIKIVEEKDANKYEKKIKEVNSGIYCFKAPSLFSALKIVKNNTAQKEYYLTDVISILNKRGEKVIGVKTENSEEIKGVNTRWELQEMEKFLKEKILKKFTSNGVSIISPETTFIEENVKIGKDTIIYPFTWISGKTVIGENCEIGPFVYLNNVKIKENAKIVFSYIRDSKIGENTNIGPFSHLRPETKIGKNVKIGNFVEIKKSEIKNNVSISHLSYIGDAEVGNNVNIGAGTITCNFDGERKHKTKIEDNAFIGSDTILVAPVKIGKFSYTGAGSTITKDVPDYALGIERTLQRNILNWKRRKKK